MVYVKNERKEIAKDILWPYLKEKNFKRNQNFGLYEADFVNKRKKLIIEIDERKYFKNISGKDKWFYYNGYEVLIFSEEEVLNNLNGVLSLINNFFN